MLYYRSKHAGHLSLVGDLEAARKYNSHSVRVAPIPIRKYVFDEIAIDSMSLEYESYVHSLSGVLSVAGEMTGSSKARWRSRPASW